MTILGYLRERWLADGTLLAVTPMTFGKGRILLGDRYGVEEAWCYETLPQALAAFEAWDYPAQAEPAGWMRHPTTGRRRPDGDADREYVAP